MTKKARGIWIPPEIYSDSRLTPVEKIICAEIGNMCANAGTFYKSNETIAAELNISPSTAKRAIATLEEYGHIHRHPFNGRNRELTVTDPSLWPNMTRQPVQNEPADRSKRPGSQTKMTRQPDQFDPAAGPIRPTKKKEKKPEKKPEKKCADMPWPGFGEVWEAWKEYKAREHRFSYKSQHSEQAALHQLITLSNNDPEQATAIVRQSIANGWKGLFAAKQRAGTPAPNAATPEESARQFEHFIRTGNL
jgi:DNA-binding transcriptional MocR family regulator